MLLFCLKEENYIIKILLRIYNKRENYMVFHFGPIFSVTYSIVYKRVAPVILSRWVLTSLYIKFYVYYVVSFTNYAYFQGFICEFQLNCWKVSFENLYEMSFVVNYFMPNLRSEMESSFLFLEVKNYRVIRPWRCKFLLTKHSIV